MRPRRQLTGSLAETLRAKASEVTVPFAPFDPERPPSLDDEDEPAPRRPLRPSLSVAAVVAAVALLSAAVAVRFGGADDGGTTTDEPSAATTQDAPPLPEGLLLPSWVPSGLDLWRVEWQMFDPGADGHTYQLFGDPSAGEVLMVWFQPLAGALAEVEGEPIAVRGQSATIAPAVHLPETTSTVTWSEEGAFVSATFRGMTSAEAVSALDDMEWRSGSDYVEGFADPGETLPLWGESALGQAGATHQTELLYSDGLPPTAIAEGRRFLGIRTSAPSGPGTEPLPPAYLLDVFYGADDGNVPTQTTDPAFGIVEVTWPDGRSVYLDPGGAEITPSTLESLLDGTRRGTTDDVAELRRQADATGAALPLVAAAELPSGTLEVHGQAPTYVLCLRLPGDERPDCGEVDEYAPPDADQGPVLVGGNYFVDGTWLVGAASPEEPPAVALTPLDGSEVDYPTRPEQGSSRADGTIPSESGRDGSWRFVLAEVPAGNDYAFASAGFDLFEAVHPRCGAAVAPTC